MKRFIIPSVLLFGAATLGACTSAASAPEATTSKVFTPETTSAAPPAEVPQILPGLNMPVRDGKFEFTVTKMECGKDQLGNQYVNTKAQGQFCLVSVTVANIGYRTQTFFQIGQKAIDAQGNTLGADPTANIYLENAKTSTTIINPGNTVKGTIVFDVPKTSQITHVLLHDSMFSNGAKVKVA